MATLPKPYAVIRKAQAPGTSGSNQGDAHVLEGDAADEESDEEREKEEEEDAAAAQGSAKKRRAEEDEDGPLFPDVQVTPVKNKKRRPSDLLSSPWSEPPTPRDYSSDLSSPPGDFWGTSEFGGDDDDEEDEDEGRAKEREEREKARERERRRKERRERRRAEAQAGRTRYYEVVAVVRKKVVFALRPEPLVKATQLPE
jgi:hypothetical protein